MPSIKLGKFLSVPDLLNIFFFNHARVLEFFQKLFCIYWGDHVVFVLFSIHMVHYIDLFSYVGTTLHSRINLMWSWNIILFFKCHWIQFASSSMNQYFPNGRRMILQNHAWVNSLFKVQGRLWIVTWQDLKNLLTWF